LLFSVSFQAHIKSSSSYHIVSEWCSFVAVNYCLLPTLSASCVQSRNITPVERSHIDTNVIESFTGLPAYSNCTFSVNARPSQLRGFVSEWSNYTHLTAEQGMDVKPNYV